MPQLIHLICLSSSSDAGDITFCFPRWRTLAIVDLETKMVSKLHNSNTSRFLMPDLLTFDTFFAISSKFGAIDLAIDVFKAAVAAILNLPHSGVSRHLQHRSNIGANFSFKWFRLTNQLRKKGGKEWSPCLKNNSARQVREKIEIKRKRKKALYSRIWPDAPLQPADLYKFRCRTYVFVVS